MQLASQFLVHVLCSKRLVIEKDGMMKEMKSNLWRAAEKTFYQISCALKGSYIHVLSVSTLTQRERGIGDTDQSTMMEGTDGAVLLLAKQRSSSMIGLW